MDDFFILLKCIYPLKYLCINLYFVLAMEKMVSELGRIIEGDLTVSVKSKWLNIVKMTTFIACKLTEAMESKYSKTSADVLQTGRVSR